MFCTVETFLENAEFIDAKVIIFDQDDNVVFEGEEVGFSVEDPKCPMPSEDIMRSYIDFWLLENTGSTLELKIYL